MNADLHLLHRDQMLRLPGPLRVQSDRGVLWITMDGEPDDIVLSPGDSVRITNSARVIVHALGGAAQARVQALAAPAAPWWQQLLHRLKAPGAAAARFV